jgi:hypothetical protein
MKRKLLLLASGLSLFTAIKSQTLPKPDHVIILMMENNGYGDIIGSANAPYMNSLANDPANAVFTQSYSLIHPSQPNYLMLYSGSNHGVFDDNAVPNTPMTSPNLGASLIAKGYTFKGYSEDLPGAGSLTLYSGSYGRKHTPWTNWQGTGANQIPASVNEPYSSFPSAYNTLPTVSFLIPNMDHDMHNPTTDANQAVRNGDTWLSNNIGNLVSWAKSSNSLLIITFDEDRGEMVNGASNTSNRITTIFIGGIVQGGSYSQHIDHYSVLRTIEDMYGLPYAGSSSGATPITYCWKTNNTTGIGTNTALSEHGVNIWPNPAIQDINIAIGSSTYKSAKLSVYDITGRLVKESKIDLHPGINESKVDAINFSSGVYIFKLEGDNLDFTRKIVVEK